MAEVLRVTTAHLKEVVDLTPRIQALIERANHSGTNTFLRIMAGPAMDESLIGQRISHYHVVERIGGGGGVGGGGSASGR